MKFVESSGVDMSYNGPPVPLYRPPSGGAVPYEDWKDEALCTREDPSLFELGDPDLISEADQQDLIAQGLMICAGCPVRAACRNSANEFDKHWTTRGGQPPEGLFGDVKPPHYILPKLKNGFAKGTKRAGKVKCKRGHENWGERKDGRRFCITCKKDGDKVRWGGGK